MERYICIHGHFYQPPRENPWLEDIELQDSAYPYHDWNERIAAECYAPNTVSRLLDGEGRIVGLTNNYARISFNFGPTLLAWLSSKAPEIYAAILAADRESREKFSGHGSALAQAYNHMIMPLANPPGQVHPGALGNPGFRAPLRAATGGHVAAGDRGGPGDPGYHGRIGDPLYHPGAPSGAQGPQDWPGSLAGRERRPDRPHYGLSLEIAVGPDHQPVFL